MLQQIMQKHNIAKYGICRFNDALPLIQCRACSRLPANPNSIIVCLLPYYIGEYPDRNISRYCIADDYHITGGEILSDICADLTAQFAGEQFVWFIDNSPINEVVAANKAGLGVIGLNNQLINDAFGSYVFIGCIVSTAVFKSSIPSNGECLNCKKCIAACPTGALSENGFKKEICRSNITQKKGKLTEFEAEQIRRGGFAWGCDICNDVCPMNSGKLKSNLPQFYKNITYMLTKDNLNNIIKQKAYGYRGIKVLERNLNILEGNGDGNE